jgi:cytochrome c biogenesis protein CcmG, thiol:disulfide interchange protein DsbE
MSRAVKWLKVFAPVAGVLALLAYGFTTNPREIRSPLLGRPARPLSLALFDGGRFVLGEQGGKAVVVNFWTSWCVPCREEAPLLEATWRAYRDRGVVPVGVNFQDTEPAARAFIAEFGLTFPNGPDPHGGPAIDYGVYGIPELFVVGRDGRITYRHVGAIGQAIMVARLEEALRGDAVTPREGRREQYQPIR